MDLITSKHLKSATELTLVAPIRSEFVWTRGGDLLPYRTRLVLVLETFFALRRAATEQSSVAVLSPLERLRSLRTFTWSLLEGGSKLLLSVTFDRAWEPYIRSIVDDAGPLLDVIFCHCMGYDLCSTEAGYVPFADWVRKHQVKASLFYAADPELTVDDQRYLKQFERGYGDPREARTFAERVARLRVGDPATDGTFPRQRHDTVDSERDAILGGQRAATAIAALRECFYVPPPALCANLAPGGVARATLEREARYFDRAGWLLLEPVLPEPPERAYEWLAPDVAEQLKELRAAAEPRGEAPRAPAPEARALGRNVQGNLLTAYSGMTHGVVLLIGFESGRSARAFLQRALPHVTREDQAAEIPVGINLALSFEGLRTLGLTELELAQFPREFQEGMQERAGLLGDVAAEHPSNWREPFLTDLDGQSKGETLGLSSVDLLLMVQVRGEGVAGSTQGSHDDGAAWGLSHPACKPVKQLLREAEGARVLHVQPLRREYMPGADLVRERFGFADGISQPEPCPMRPAAEADRVALGEVLLGYAGDRGEAYPHGPEEWCRDGSFLVVRKLEQDAEALQEFVDEHAALFTHGRGGAEELYGKLMGRYRDGAPLASSTRRPVTAVREGRVALNEFDYQGDPEGGLCPLNAHARRTNPRTPPQLSVHGRSVRLPRILRRGFSYGPLSGSSSRAARGLLFMAYNASIAEQFEVIQRWINGGNSTGVASSHADPIVSHRAPAVIHLLEGGQPRHLLKRRPFVTLKWGHYFFVPSLPALGQLASLPEGGDGPARAAASRALADRGARVLAELEKLTPLHPVPREASVTSAHNPLPSAQFAWKAALEDRRDPGPARALWAAIREDHGGVLRTPYGVLVGSAAHVKRVLSEEATFSVREYWHRMQQTLGQALYLGMDRCPVARPCPTGEDADYERSVRRGSYDGRATDPNLFMRSLRRQDALRLAREETARALDVLLAGRPRPPAPIVDLRWLVRQVACAISKKWFGLPLEPVGYGLFHAAALAIFSPHPEPSARAVAEHQRTQLMAEVSAATGRDSQLRRSLETANYAEAMDLALAGGAQGLLPVIVGSFLSVAHQWLESERFVRLAQWLRPTPGSAELNAQLGSSSAPSPERPRRGCATEPPGQSALERELLAALARQPVPDLLYRTVVAPTCLGHAALKPSDRVVVSLASALADAPAEHDLLFGGPLAGDGAGPTFVHACPGKEAALGILLGMWVELLSRNIAPEGVLRVSIHS